MVATEKPQEVKLRGSVLPPRSSLMEVLAKSRESILEKWMDKVRRDDRIPSSDDIDRFILRDDMPGILRQLIVSLGKHMSGILDFDEAIVRAAESEYMQLHIQSRLRHGYQLPEALREYFHLRSVIIDTWIEAETIVNRTELRLLHGAIDELIIKASTQVTDEYVAAKDLFLTKLSHELNSPITAITTNLEIIKGREYSEDLFKKSLGAVQRNADLLLAIAADLNDLSKIVLGKFRLQPTLTQVSAVLTSVFEWALPILEHKGIQLSLDLNDDSEILLDETKVHQALVNLLINAARFTPKGGHVRLTCEVNEYIEFIVIDDGEGIDPTVFKSLFDWPTLDKPEVAGKAGLGLGLPIAKEIAELHNGEIRAGNNPDGKGAVFALRIPRKLRPD